MHFFRTAVIVTVSLAIGLANAQGSGEGVVNIEKAKAMAEQLKNEGFTSTNPGLRQDEQWLRENQQKIIKQAQALQQQMPELSSNSLDKNYQQYQQAAQELSNTSMAGMRNGLEKQLSLSNEEANLFGDENSINKEEEFAIFISFSMSEAEIKSALVTASIAGGKVFLKGLKEGHESITQTMKAIRQIADGIENPPETRFNPKAFETYGVTQVPTIIFQNKDKVYLAKGIMNLGWLRAQAHDGVEPGDLGVKGPTYPVHERSIIESIEKRMASYDWEGQKQKTIKSFWARQQFETLPASKLDKVWFINPTVRVKSDVVNPRGDVLARAGDIINPLNIPTGQQSFLLFDATDTRQLEWATKELAKDFKGPVVIMTSQVSKDHGWDHLDTLRQHFQREIYLIPKELIKRFHLTALPVLITPDMSKKVFRVEQFEMEIAQ